MNKVYAVITMDIIGSKKSKEVLNKFLIKNELINELNYYLNKDDLIDDFLKKQSIQSSVILKRKDLILTDITISRGDELQVVCKNIYEIPYILRCIRYYLRPLKIRVGVGIGGINTDLDEESSWNMNGEAFYNARQALEILSYDKEAKNKTHFVTGNCEHDLILNTMYILMDTIMDKWTDAKWNATFLYDEYKKYENAAIKLGVSPEAVRKSCKRANWSSIANSEKNIKKYLEIIDYNR